MSTGIFPNVRDAVAAVLGPPPTVQQCYLCGCVVIDGDVHVKWHADLADLARKVLAPDATDEEWAQMIAEAQSGVAR